MIRKAFAVLVLCIAATLAATTALRASWLNSPVGQWTFSYWNDESSTMASTGGRVICFRADGTWNSPTNEMAGRWFQKGTAPAGYGNRVRLYGNWGDTAGGSIAMELDFMNENLMAGALTIWRAPSLSVHPTPWMQTQAQRTAASC